MWKNNVLLHSTLIFLTLINNIHQSKTFTTQLNSISDSRIQLKAHGEINNDNKCLDFKNAGWIIDRMASEVVKFNEVHAYINDIIVFNISIYKKNFNIVEMRGFSEPKWRNFISLFNYYYYILQSAA